MAVIYKDKIVEKIVEKPVEKIVYKDKIVEKEVIKEVCCRELDARERRYMELRS